MYEIDKSKVTDFPQYGHINYAAYYNLKIAEILPQDVHRLIYMDDMRNAKAYKIGNAILSPIKKMFNIFKKSHETHDC